MRNDGVLAEIRQIPKSPLQPKIQKIDQNVIVQEVLTMNMKYTIDATNKILGRLATEIAILLRGKNDPSFAPNRLSGNTVVVTNADKISVTGGKERKKIYYRHSGYPGGLKEESLARLMSRDSRLVVRRAVLGMLPKNKLRNVMIRNLVLYKQDAG